MKTALAYNKDALAGLLMLGIGGIGFVVALDYPFGSALRMGPGYFPRVLACILMAFGAFVLVRGLRTGERVEGRWGWKALAFICVSLIVFGFTMERYGLVPALVAMFLLATLGGHEFRFVEVLVLTVIMTIFSVVVFVHLLGMPYPLVQGF
ncbi:MAG TPA: tripartite tricarboxylate transporter TctB family protein [Burkholderiales bacterium]|nr:tripartite tricarboxylate transporter TctB family protein [Burkholderiales bacterium]